MTDLRQGKENQTKPVRLYMGIMDAHLKAQCADGKDGITWDQLQQIKDEHLEPEVAAVEFYPPATNVVDELNMRHLWEVPEEWLPMR